MSKRISFPIGLLFIFFVAVGASCATTENPTVVSQSPKVPLLNSERIKQKFGSYGVEVLRSKSPHIRISKLYSVHDGVQVARTFAITTFSEPMNSALLEGHALITQKNQSIGSTFKDLGWVLTKRNLYFGDKEFANPCLYKMMSVNAQSLAVHIYELLLSKADEKNLSYAVIAELQHPDYLAVDDLKAIYGETTMAGNLDGIWQSIDVAINKLKCESSEL